LNVANHQILVGGGWRATKDEFRPGPNTAYTVPAESTLNNANAFAQDTIGLTSSLDLIAGVKAEKNDYTGWEYLPNLRLSWRLPANQLVWAAVSRAVRTPSRLDRDLYTPALINGGPDFTSEDLIAYELGYRAQPTDRFWFSASAYYNVYDKLRTLEATTPAIYPLEIRKWHGGRDLRSGGVGRLCPSRLVATQLGRFLATQGLGHQAWQHGHCRRFVRRQ
jgi:iron complex outermembrane receptor protein